MTRSPPVRDLFDEALSRPEGERAAFLDQACKGDQVLRVEVAELLIAFEQAHSFLEPAHANTESTAMSPPQDSLIGQQIGRYTIRREIATGGMGTVYEAMQDQPRRAVAIKVMKHGIASRSALRRFEYESQILARLRHPGIAQVYDAGMHDDGTGAVPYFALEYIPNAQTLIEFAESKQLSTRERLLLFIKVCQAVHFGHSKGIIHRDLKPGNILVDSTTGLGEPKIIDFGVARATDSDVAATTLQTGLGQIIGTLQYMSPEQCDADPHDLDTRSDVYSLGVVLYELLTGQPPYDLGKVPIYEAVRVIREERPRRLSAIKTALRGDLETITLKALEKNRGRRYPSTAEMSDDLRRYLNHEPISARPASFAYQLRMFARRNRILVRSLAAIFLMLSAAVVTVSVLWARAERARADKAEIADAATALFGEQLHQSVQLADRAGQHDLARQIIDGVQKVSKDKFTGHPEVEYHVISTVAKTCSGIGAHDKAVAEIDHAVQLARATFGEYHVRTTLTARFDRAQIYRGMTDHARAEEAFEAVIDDCRRHVPQRDWPLQVWHGFADMLHDLGRCSEAEALFREALDLMLKKNEIVAYYAVDLAGVLRDRQRFDEAERVLADALDQIRREGIRHGGALPRTWRELGRLHLYAGRTEQARAWQQQALNGYFGDPNNPENSMDALLCIELGALIEMAENRFEPALAAFDSIAQRAEQTLMTEPEWWAAHFRAQQAICLIRLQDYDKAEPILAKAYETLHKRLGDPHHRTQNCIRALVELHEAMDDAEATEWKARLRPAGCH